MAIPNRTTPRRLFVIGARPETVPRQTLRQPKTRLFLTGIVIAQIAATQSTTIAGATPTETVGTSEPGARRGLPKFSARSATPDDANGCRYKTASAASTIPVAPPLPPATWPVQISLKNTLRVWAQRQGWPTPQFLTEADWAVDVPGSVSGSIEEALKALAEGFGQSQTRPRIEVTGNHVILVSEVGAE